MQIVANELPEKIVASAETVIEIGNSPGPLALQEKMFSNTFIAGSEATFSVIMAAGEAVPAIGPIFTILRNIKENVDLYSQANEECS